jgi:hypothetical protein
MDSLKNLSLAGEHISLVPLGPERLPGLLAASSFDPSLYRWTFAPQSEPEMGEYIETALAAQRAETRFPLPSSGLRTGS